MLRQLLQPTVIPPISALRTHQVEEALGTCDTSLATSKVNRYYVLRISFNFLLRLKSFKELCCSMKVTLMHNAGEDMLPDFIQPVHLQDRSIR